MYVIFLLINFRIIINSILFFILVVDVYADYKFTINCFQFFEDGMYLRNKVA